jgi:hypothetical protein
MLERSLPVRTSFQPGMCEVTLQYLSSFGMSIEITFQRRRIPLERVGWLHGYRIHFCHSTAHEKGRAHEFPRSQFTESPSVLGHSHLSPDEE